MTQQTKTNSPVITLRDGSIKASIWRNPSEKGHFYSVSYSRTYVDGGTEEKPNFKDSDSFSGTDNLKIAQLAQRAYQAVLELREQDAQANSQGSN